MRGVQLFDMLLTEQLLGLDLDLTLVVESTWARRLQGRMGCSGARVISTPSLIKPLWNTLAAQGRVLSGGPYDAVIVGNPTRGLAPLLRTMRRKGLAERVTLLAHRTVREGFARSLTGDGVTVVCVNREIEAQARGVLPSARVVTRYGIPNAGVFHPRADGREESGESRDSQGLIPGVAGDVVRFGVLGKLDNPWKGAGDAIEAFGMLPADVRARCELHLASYERRENCPPLDDERIIAHPWMDSSETPGLLRGWDVLLVPSTSHETFSQAIVQGMLTGLPVIARDLPVLAEKLDTGGGIVVDGVVAMSEAMARLACDAALRSSMGAIARATALERYVWDTASFVRDSVLAGAVRA
ncbi:MAG: glycosyltransferase family 4 protein [Phycisphaeraceae bacterium]|nr:glycosyltransferase family 4 protein [Phycisphaeraceae bacterium]MCB9848109.1 glycosyltransferase family 4 protein [Phycisphaeraceae bacterium]